MSSFRSSVGSDSTSLTSVDEKLELAQSALTESKVSNVKGPVQPNRHWWSWKLRPMTTTDIETGRSKTRKTVLLGPIYVGVGAGAALCKYPFSPFSHKHKLTCCCADFSATGLAVLLKEFALDGDFTRFALCATLPFVLCVSVVRISLASVPSCFSPLVIQFFCLQLVGNISLVCVVASLLQSVSGYVY